MPRSPRVVLPGVPLHVVQRGAHRADTFFSTEDFERFRSVLCEASRRFECSIHAYVLMTNHVHLLLTPEDDRGPARMMQAIGRAFVQHYVNARYSHTGTLWEGRYRSSLVNSDGYLFACSRYIELNPLRARMTDEPEQYPWSSYRHNGLGIRDPLITPHALYKRLGKRPADRQAAYRALFEDPIDPEALEAIRRATNRGDILGDDAFRKTVGVTLGRSLTRPRHGGDRRGAAFRASKTRDVCRLAETFQVV